MASNDSFRTPAISWRVQSDNLGTLCFKICSMVQSDNFYLGYRIPFKWGVNFNEVEVAIDTTPNALNAGEQAMAATNNIPNGMIGFSMLYWQVLYIVHSTLTPRHFGDANVCHKYRDFRQNLYWLNYTFGRYFRWFIF